MTDAGNDVQKNTNKQTNTLFIKGEIQNGPQQKQNTKKKKPYWSYQLLHFLL